MIWKLAWSWVAQHRDFPSLHLSAAERIDAALLRFAATGRGALTRVDPEDPNRFRLRVEGAEARLFVDQRERTILVTRVYKRGL